jgi:hypothetical protein
MGHFQAEQPNVLKVLVRPAHMIISPTDTALVLPFPQNAPQAAAYPLIQTAKDPFSTVFKIPKPANQGLIDFPDNSSQAVPVTVPSLLAQRLLQLRQTLLPRPPSARFEVIAQEVKPGPGIGHRHQTGLFRMQVPVPVPAHPPLPFDCGTE